MNEQVMHAGASQEKLPLDYFVLVFALAVPFYLFGGGKLPLPINLPIAALATFVPALAAAIVSYRHQGAQGVRALLRKAWDYRKIKNKLWYLPTLLLQPLIYLTSYAILRWTGSPLPEKINVPLLVAPVFFVLFFIGDAGEESGWSGYAIDPMQARWGALKASLILGVIWAIWHFIPYIQTGNPASWVVWQTLTAVAIRVLIVWIYNNTGKSVFAAILFHVMTNLSWTLFPNYGSHFNPFVTGVLTWLTVIIVILIWEPKTLARYRHAGSRSTKASSQ